RIHPDDAARLQLQDRGQARVISAVAERVFEVEVSDDVMPGVVSIPHGFGHVYPDSQQGLATSVHPGRSCNDLIDESLDVASSTCVVNGVPVTLQPV
ncbi:MAG: molybdopterin dinucleotide binding domain-containing protein, partial [Halioglobus sp.]|nr:molybdopterin dinucleotide binding domain-containing protein [Halioglobus sp.]